MQTRTCPDLNKELASLLASGYRLDMIMPADDPRGAIVSKDGEKLRLVQSSTTPSAEAAATPPIQEGCLLSSTTPSAEAAATPSTQKAQWITGRAGMEYRDLIPDRLGGRLIASHIRIVDGGEVADYVHYHKLAFQMIYCKEGWIRVVYEDQGPPFVMNAGDCILQPPEIRHRVLESSAGAEVIELSSPAVHETWTDHDMQLPTSDVVPGRTFNGQKFARHVASEAPWSQDETSGFESRDTGIFDATGGIADVRIVRVGGYKSGLELSRRTKAPTFIFVLKGDCLLNNSEQRLVVGDCVVLSSNVDFVINASPELEYLQATLTRI